MPAEFRLESAHGGALGAPLVVAPLAALRLSRADRFEIDAVAPVIQPQNQSVYTYERWVRLWCTEAAPLYLTNLKLLRLGQPIPGVIERWGVRDVYEPPVDTPRYAMQTFPTTILELDDQQYGTGQVGPWIVLQWELTRACIPGPQGPVIYRIRIDEY